MNTITRENQLARRRFLAGGLAAGAAVLLSSSLSGMVHAATPPAVDFLSCALYLS